MGVKWDMRSFIHAQKMASVFFSMNGDHRQSVSTLERLRPSVLLASGGCPFILTDYNNSLAIELAEVGRFAEARMALNFVKSSPFYALYPGLRETNKELSVKLSLRPQRRPRPRSILKSAPLLDMNEWRKRKQIPDKDAVNGLTLLNEKILRICADLVDGPPLTEKHLYIIERIVAAYDAPDEVLDKVIETLNVHLPMEGLNARK